MAPIATRPGFLLSMVQLAGMSLGLAIGLAADSFGLLRSMLLGLGTLAVASVAGAWARDASDLLVLRALEGFGLLMAALPAPSLIRQLVPLNRLSAMLGLWGAYMPLGSALGLLFGPLVLGAIGWQGWWWGLGGLTAAMALWLAIGVPPDGRRGAVPARAPAPSSPWAERLGRTLRARGPWLVALSFAVYSSQWLAVIGFLPSIYVQAGIGGATVGLLTALAAAVNIIGNVASGRLLQRGLQPRTLLIAGFSAMALGAYLAFALAPGQPFLRYAGVLVFSMLGGMIPGTLFSLAVRLAPGDDTISTTVGWMQQWSAAGQFAGPPLVAWVAGLVGGWQWTWAVTGACSLVGALLAVQVSGALRAKGNDEP